jgi:hypothetical protein
MVQRILKDGANIMYNYKSNRLGNAAILRNHELMNVSIPGNYLLSSAAFFFFFT